MNSNIPINVRESSTTTAGAINGKISAKVDAKTMARTHAPVANDGLYVLG